MYLLHVFVQVSVERAVGRFGTVCTSTSTACFCAGERAESGGLIGYCLY